MARLRFLPVIFLQAATLHFSPSLATKNNFIGTQAPLNIHIDTMAKQLSDLSFKRIRVTTGDIDRLYPVLAGYVQNPDLASTVTELVIDVPSWPGRYGGCLGFNQEDQQAPTAAPGPDEVAAHKQIEAHARALGLGSEATTFMLESLSWKFNGEPSPSTDPYSHSPNSSKAFASVASTLLLSLCPNITLLHAYGLEQAPPPLVDFLLRNNYGLLPGKHLQRLERVHMQAWSPDDNRQYDRLEFLDYFRYFGRLPALRTYSADAVMDYQADRDLAVPGSSPSITKISITNAEVGGDMLGTIMRVPRALEEMTVSLGGLSSFEGGMALVNPKTLGKCLLEHKTTLKKLDLDIACMVISSGRNMDEAEDDPYQYGEENDWVYGKDEYFRLDEQAGNGRPLFSFDLPNTRRYGLTIGSLHDFEALEHLAISVRLMLGPVVRENVMGQRREGETVIPPFRLVDALPRTLKSLHLYDYVVGECPLADEHVKELKEKMADVFPFLTEVSGLDEPLIKNSKYDENSGYDEENPSELAVVRVHNRGLDWEFA